MILRIQTGMFRKWGDSMTTIYATSTNQPTNRELTDIELLDRLTLVLRLALEHAEAAKQLEYEVILRARERGATAIITDGCTAELVPNVAYDQSRFTPLLEILPPEGVAEAYIPSHTETKTVPAKWITVKAQKWARKVGAEAQRIIDAARMEGSPSVKLTTKR